MDLRPGQPLGEYRLDSRVGRGGMGTVFRARHARIGRTVALKVLRDPALSDRFLNEARIQAGLRHPNVATLYDYFECDGHACIAMEYVEGETLAEHVRQRGALPADDAARLLRPVAEAVATLHRHGIIHRDLKTHNVKVTPEGRVMLLDFGIAKEIDQKGITTGGAVPGTPEYLSPEQVHGQTPDARSDVWSLGVLFYELLTGDVPFQAPSTFSLFEQITQADYDPASARRDGIPAWADAVVARCLRRRPSDRYRDAGELLRALPGAPSDTPALLAPSVTPAAPDRRQRSDRRQQARDRRASLPSWAPWAVLAASLVALAAVLLPGLGTTRGDVAPTPDIVADSTPAARPIPAGAAETEVVIDAVGDPADVYLGGERVGQTPFALDSYVGEDVEIELRRGDLRETVRFQTTPGKRAYTVSL
ncbi:MAG: serine/threonine-protein kinase [Bacteroidota bacterium]